MSCAIVEQDVSQVAVLECIPWTSNYQKITMFDDVDTSANK